MNKIVENKERTYSTKSTLERNNMSIEYSFAIGFGYEFTEKELEAVAKLIPAKTYLEDMYDYNEDIGQFIAQNIQCDCIVTKNYLGDGSDSKYILGPVLETQDDRDGCDNITIGGSFLYEDLISKRVAKDLKRIKLELSNLGLKIRPPIVKIGFIIS